MSIPKDGYYIATVLLDSGGATVSYVEVRDGTPLSRHGFELLPSACSNFFECSTVEYQQGWPERAALELDAIRTANKALVEQLAAHKAVVEDPAALWANWMRGTVKLPAGIGDVRQHQERVKRLEAWGDRLEELLGDPPNANCSCHISPPCNDCVEWAAIREAKTEWSQAKEAKL